MCINIRIVNVHVTNTYHCGMELNWLKNKPDPQEAALLKTKDLWTFDTFKVSSDIQIVWIRSRKEMEIENSFGISY